MARTLQRLREYHSQREMRQPPATVIDVALVVPDMKTARKIQNTVAVITPSSWHGRAQLHVIVGNNTTIDNELRVLMASLNWIRHHDLDLIYPQELEIGWENE